MKNYTNQWKPKEPIKIDVPHIVVATFTDFIRNQLAAFKDFFPFFNLWNGETYFNENYCIIKIEELYHRSGTVTVGEIKDNDLINNCLEIFEQDEYPSYSVINEKLGEKAYLFDRFTYVGKVIDGKLSFQHIQEVLIDYINYKVAPIVFEQNIERVKKALPEPPFYDAKKIMSNIFIVESDAESIQGTAFYLKGYGFISCEHSIASDTVIFKADDYLKKYPIKIIKSNSVIDLAVFHSEIELDNEFEIGNPDLIEVMEHIIVAGFPNYRYGDSGIISPGIVAGFRTVSSIRRILTNIPLIAGNSGGPIIDKEGKVVGVAVTGADRMENAQKTENHGIIPINALDLIK